MTLENVSVAFAFSILAFVVYFVTGSGKGVQLIRLTNKPSNVFEKPQPNADDGTKKGRQWGGKITQISSTWTDNL